MSTILEARDIEVSFGGFRALQGVSVAVEQGTVVGLIGPNGAGKTTLFNVMTGLTRPDSGDVFLAGAAVSRRPPHVRARLGLARSFQHLGLMLYETVETNLLASRYLNAGYRDRDVIFHPRRWYSSERRLAEAAGTTLEALGLTSHADDVVAELPYATARLVELACVLSTDASVVLLDEPTTGLDLAEIDLIQNLLARMRHDGLTLLTIAHDVHFVMDLCDVVYVLSEGRGIAADVPERVQQDPAVIRAYLGTPK